MRNYTAELKQRKQAKLVYKKRLRWIVDVLCMDNNRICITALTRQPEGKRKVGRHKTTWRMTVETERDKIGMNSWEKAKTETNGGSALWPYAPLGVKRISRYHLIRWSE